MDWVFAYGSLLPAGHAVLPEGAVAADLHGWRRSWSVAMDNSVDLPDYKHYVAPDGHRPDLMVCYLDIDERPDAVVNGVALKVGADELPALDARERNYERRDVAGQLNVRLGGRVWAYVGRRPAGPAPGAGAASGAWPSRAATTSACWPASTSCASGGASRCSPSRRACRSPTCRSCATRRWPCRAAYVEPCMWLIDLFEVAPESDDAFLADWESERGASAVLYRALRADADFASSPSRPSTTARRRPVSTRSSTRRARPTGPKASPSSTPSRSPRARTSASSPAGSAPAPRWPTSAATSGRAFIAASARATCASSTSHAGRAR